MYLGSHKILAMDIHNKSFHEDIFVYTHTYFDKIEIWQLPIAPNMGDGRNLHMHLCISEIYACR